MRRSTRIDPQPCDVAAIELSGVNLIEASAGTGKTHTITYLYLRLLIERELVPGNIVVVTFTEAATKELRDRIRSVLAEALAPTGADPLRDAILASCRERFGREAVERRLRRALVRFDEAAIFTIHGFCNRMLADNCFESGRLFDTELITDQQEILQEIIDDFWRITFVRSPLPAAVAAAGGMTLDSLHNLAGLLIRSPLVVCEPEADIRSLEHLQALYERLQALWRRSGDRVCDLLRTFSGFKKKYCERLEEILSGAGQALDGLPDAEGLRCLERLSPDALADGVDKRKATAPPAHPLFDLCEDFRGARRAALLQLRQRFCAYLRQELPVRKRRQNVQCFEDLLLDLLAALRAPDAGALCTSIRRQFKAALIDEFQDTDPVQYEIFMRLFAEADPCSLFLIGDPKQSIYGFRGADIFSYIAAAKRTPPRKRYTLTVNWRSESDYVAAVNRFFADVRNPFAIGGGAVRYIPVVADPASRGNTLPLRIDGKPAAELRLWVAAHDPHQATDSKRYLPKEAARSLALQATVREISRLLALSAEGRATIGTRPLKPSDIAILVLRNEDARLFIEPLRVLQIPAVIARTGSVFHTAEADDVHRLVRAVAAPQRTEYLNAALVTPLIGCDAEMLRRYREDEGAAPEYEEHRSRFGALNRLWAEQGFIRMFREALAVYGVRERVLGFPDGERRLTNVLHLGELLHEAAVTRKLGMQGLLAFLRRSRTDEGGEDEHELRLERDDEAVQILTVFKSKGLQYPIVFCPFMWQWGALDKQGVDTLYHRDGVRYLFLDDNDEGWRAARRERLAELMRLLYVALTRAQNRCYLVCGRIAEEVAVTALDYCAAGGEDNPDAVLEATQRAVAGMDVRTMSAALQRFADTTLRVEPITEAALGNAVPYRPAQPTGRITGCREFDASVIDREHGTASFSSLTAARHAAVGDESVVRQDEPSAEPGDTAQETAEGFFAFPHGPLPGTCIHAIFERLDFTRADTPDADALIRSLLDRYGLLHGPDPESRFAAVRDMVGRVLDAPLVPLAPACTLRTVAPAQRLAEIAFYYPLRRLTPEFLHNLLSRHAGEAVGSGAITIGPLAFNPVSGYLQGVMDFVFHHEGRFFLLDWKTNYLGASYEDYAPERLAVVMRDMHYTLQYLLYTVALDRYLAQRMPDYDYDRHFGGVLYLFVRGMHPDRPGNGIAHALPPHELIAEIGSYTG